MGQHAEGVRSGLVTCVCVFAYECVRFRMGSGEGKVEGNTEILAPFQQANTDSSRVQLCTAVSPNQLYAAVPRSSYRHDRLLPSTYPVRLCCLKMCRLAIPANNTASNAPSGSRTTPSSFVADSVGGVVAMAIERSAPYIAASTIPVARRLTSA